MATTEIFYTGDNSTTLYTFPFEYITKDDVKVSINDVDTTAYTYANDTVIEFNSAPLLDERIRIYRLTNVDDLKATFASGSSIRAVDLNNNFQQNNFAVEELRNYTWDNEIDTIHSDETWVSSDTSIATTAAMDQRFLDEADEVILSTEAWASNDDSVASTASIDARVDSKIDAAITGDIATDGTGITITDDGDGTITLGLGANSIDFDRIKDADIITAAEQDSGTSAADSNVFTGAGAARRFDTIVQLNNPGTSTNWQVGKTWLQNDEDNTLSIWNGSAWVAVSSGGAFTELAKVIYVDSINGDDALSGHRISNPKRTIRAAIADINADPAGDGSIVVVAPGIYGEQFPIDIQRNDIAIVGTSLRNCIIHPSIPAADQAGYDVDVPEPNELQSMFRVNSGTYVANLTLMGMKAAGARGGNALDTDVTHGLPTDQGWNFSFFPNATIRKSPYIQNCTNFSDSQINNVTFTPHTPGEGAAGDLDSAPSGGGILVNGATVNANSPLRSMVCDSYTHTALDGPGIFVTNNGYCQATSSYSFFNHYHLKCLNGGQANVAASTTDFGRFSLIADGRSTTNIFTSSIDDPGGLLTGGQTTFNINAPVADPSWHGSETRPQANMLVQVNGITYPILTAVPHTDSEGNDGWTVEISRPDPNNRNNNLGINGAIADDALVQFFLRSMIASSGHTMEYVGSGTDYRALPENGGIPIEANQKVELNDGAIWAATTDHNGKFRLGGNQTTDPIFEVDQQLGFVTIPEGSISFNLLSDRTPQLGGTLDLNDNIITNEGGNIVLDPTTGVSGSIQLNGPIDNAGSGDIVISGSGGGNLEINRPISSPGNQNVTLMPGGFGTGTGQVDVTSHRIINLADPAGAQDAATRDYVDRKTFLTVSDTAINLTDQGSNGRITFTTDNIVNAFFDRTNGNIFTAETFASDFNLRANGSQGTLTFREDQANGDHGLTFQAPSNVTADVTFTLPDGDGTTGQALITDGTGTLSWGEAGGGATGGGTDDVFYENSQTVTTDYTISTNKNAMTAGPITINSGITVTVPSGSSWVIV